MDHFQDMSNRRPKQVATQQSIADDDLSKHKKRKKSQTDLRKLLVIPLMVALGFGATYGYNYWLATRVNTPLNEHSIVEIGSYRSADNLDRYWGSYR